MKKPFKSVKKRKYWLRRLKKINKRLRKKKKKYQASRIRLNPNVKPIAAWHGIRKSFVGNYYSRREYNENTRVIVPVPKEIGLEKDINGFLDFAASFVDSSSEELIFDMSKCEFIWPSAITLLCSLKQWFDLTRLPTSNFPQVASGRSNSDSVNSYLSHCGFYDYVRRPKDLVKTKFDDNTVVKILKEKGPQNLTSRIKETKKLLREYSSLTPDQIEDFGDSVLTEVFLNVTEHGVNYSYAGWYTLTQYRPTTGVITLCVADNGIGIKNSLITGPQHEAILKKYGKNDQNDGELILEALKENVSGAWKASNKTEGIIFKSYERGERRGLGLTRIKDCCKRVDIPMTIVSGKGAFHLSNGNEQSYSKDKRVFAGTMYHFLIPAKKEEIPNVTTN
jgi:hypothetical protein